MSTFFQKKIFFKINIFVFISIAVFCICTKVVASEDGNKWYDVYKNLPEVKTDFYRGEDPDQYYDDRKFNISPYPLMRTSTALYCKNVTILPDYYLLTPREYNGHPAILFKQKGQVKYVVPVYQKEIIDPKIVYKLPPPKKTAWWKKPFIWIGKHTIGKLLPSQKQYAFPNSKMDAYDLFGPFYEIDLYYESNLYRMIFLKNNDDL